MLGQETPALKADDIVNPLNTMWVLVTAFLVFFMQAGFMMLEAGSREPGKSRTSCSSASPTRVCAACSFWAFGFAFMFGTGNGLIGHEYFFLNNAPRDVRLDRRRVPGVLLVPVRVRRHVQHDHVGRDGRSHRVRRRPALQHRGERVHLPDHRPLGLGSRRLARHDGHAVPRLRRLDGRAHDRRHASPSPVRSRSARASVASSSATAAACRPVTT